MYMCTKVAPEVIPYTANNDYSRFPFVVLAYQISVIGNEMCRKRVVSAQVARRRQQSPHIYKTAACK